MGHLGVDCLLTLLHQRVFLPDVSDCVQMYFKLCEPCLLFMAKTEKASVERYTAAEPFELWHMDFLKLDPCKGGIENVLVVIDHFSRFAWTIPTCSQAEAVTADALWRFVFSQFGGPKCIISDQGANFVSQLVFELCTLASTTKLKTTIYHPQCNGAAERFNRTLLKLLGTLPENQKADWKNYITSMVHAHNSLHCTVTSSSPFYLMFEREPWVPLDTFTSSMGKPTISPHRYIRRFKEWMTWAFEQTHAHQQCEIEHLQPYSSQKPFHLPDWDDPDLKNQLRKFIRKHLLTLDPTNLFIQVPQLKQTTEKAGLPEELVSYLLYEQNLEVDWDKNPFRIDDFFDSYSDGTIECECDWYYDPDMF